MVDESRDVGCCIEAWGLQRGDVRARRGRRPYDGPGYRAGPGYADWRCAATRPTGCRGGRRRRQDGGDNARPARAGHPGRGARSEIESLPRRFWVSYWPPTDYIEAAGLVVAVAVMPPSKYVHRQPRIAVGGRRPGPRRRAGQGLRAGPWSIGPGQKALWDALPGQRAAAPPMARGHGRHASVGC